MWSLLSASLFLFLPLGHAAPEPAKCPDPVTGKEGAGPAPAFSFVAKDRYQMYACGKKVDETLGETEKQKIRLTEFDLYFRIEDGDPQKILAATALEHYRLWPDKGTLQLEELIRYKGGWLPGFSSQIECDSDICVKSSDQCVFKVPESKKEMKPAKIKKGKKKKIAKKKRRKRRTRGSKRLEKAKPLTADTIQATLEKALEGNEAALKFFRRLPKGTRLEAEASEAYQNANQLVQRMRSLRCL